MTTNKKTFLGAISVAALMTVTTNQAFAVVIAGTDFTGRTVSGNTASNITWTANGISDPGSLTAVDVNGTGLLAGLFDTADAQGHFAPDLNTGNEGPWSVSIPLDLTVSQIAVSSVTLDWQHFNNSGDFQGPNRQVDWTAEVIGSVSGSLGSVTALNVSGTSGVEMLTFAAPLNLNNSESYNLRILAEGSNTTGNNTGLDAVTINGPVPLPPGLTYAQAVLADGPAAYYRLDETGGTTAFDSSGNGHDGTYFGGPALNSPGLLTGDPNAAVSFDRSDDYVDTNFSFDPSATSFTIEAIIDPTDLSGGNQDIVQQLDGGGTGRTLLLVHNTDSIHSFLGGATRDSLTAATPGTPQHVAFVYTETGPGTGSFDFYIDGMLTNSGNVTPEPAGGNMVLAVNKNLNGAQFGGTLDEVAFYLTPLSADRVATHAELALNGPPLEGAEVVFSTGFEYSGGEPTVGTDAANLNGADGQIGAFSGTLPTGAGGEGGAEIVTFQDGPAPNRVMLLDRGTADGTLTANLSSDILVEGATISFDYGTRRTQANHDKDVDIIGFDAEGQESFHLVVSANSGGAEQERLGFVSGGAATFDLPTVSGDDANDDLPNTGAPPFDAADVGSITLDMTASGFTVDFLRDGRSYTTDVLGYNGLASALSRIEFQFRGGADNPVRSGFFLDNLSVAGTPAAAAAIPEPSTFALAALGLLGVGVVGWRRRR